MLNYIWLGLIAVAVVMGGFHGNIGDVGNAAVDSAKDAVILVGGLLGIMTMWLGLMRLADKAGLVKRLGLLLKPILVWLFPEVPANHPAMGSIVLNVAANILGLNSAATPLGLRAMSELDSLNKKPGVATNAMCMLLAINTSSITLIPVSVLALLALYHGKNPTVVIGTSLAATAVAHICAIATCKLLERTSWSKRQLLVDVESPQTREAHKSATEGGEIARTASEADAMLPWVPGSKWILAGFSAIFMGLVLGLAFPELPKYLALWFDQMLALAFPVLPKYLVLWFDQVFNLDSWIAAAQESVPTDTLARFWLLRVVDALSLLVLPWLILLFPLYATLRGIPVYDEFVEGGKEGFQVVLRILPYVVGMLVAVGMFRAAGGLDFITAALSPVTNFLHFPAQLVPIAVIRPFSYAAALGLLTEMVKNPALGPDNIITLMAATFYGCSETTFYVIAVYFGSVGVRKTRHAIPAGVVADIVGPIAAVVICRAVLG